MCINVLRVEEKIGGMSSGKLTKHRMSSAEIEVRKSITWYLKFEYKSV